MNFTETWKPFEDVTYEHSDWLKYAAKVVLTGTAA